MTRSIKITLLFASLLLGCGGSGAANSSEAAAPTNVGPAPAPTNPSDASAASVATTTPHTESPAPPPPPLQATSGPKTEPLKNAGVDESALVGQLTPDQLQAILQKYAADFDKCGRTNKAVSYVGKVVMKLTIGPSGKANAVERVSATPRSAVVESCLTDTFKKVEFPKPKNGQAQIIRFPIEFEQQQVQH